MRMPVELGYVAAELLHAETGMSREAILAETAEMQKAATLVLTQPLAVQTPSVCGSWAFTGNTDLPLPD